MPAMQHVALALVALEEGANPDRDLFQLLRLAARAQKSSEEPIVGSSRLRRF